MAPDMVSPTCTRCRRVIPQDDVNVAKDVAYCRICNLACRLSAMTDASELTSGVDLARPPAGAWQQREGMNTVIGASSRSVGAALGALAAGLFWNGIVSIFVLFALAGTLKNLGIALPAWFPAPTMNEQPMSVGMTIFLWLFLTPFILIGMMLMGAFLLAAAGRTELSIGRSEASVFTGIGPIGYRRRFDPQAVTDVRLDLRRWQNDSGRPQTCIVIESASGKRLTCGALLPEDRKRFVAAAVRHALLG